MQETNTTTSRRRLTLAAWLGLYLLLVVPVEVAHHMLGGTEFSHRHVLGLTAGMIVLAIIQSAPLSPLVRLLSTLAILLALAIRVIHAGLVHFSGSGFTQEFFIHLQWESVSLAWSEYRLAILLLGVAMLAIAGLCLLAFRHTPRLRATPALVLLALCLPAMFWARAAMPEWQLLRSAQHWFAPVAISISPDVLHAWQQTGLVETQLIPKHQVRAKAPEQPRNLILVYLESVGASLATHPDHPDLMPFLRHQLERSVTTTRVQHSSFITIEGIVNSQCGTLFQFERGSESLLGFEGVAEDLPCLGDVLSRAGYAQSYLGGADLEFGGKGRFLASHGYDTVIGQHELIDRDIHQRPDTWGVSDADLFQLALEEVDALRASGQPFNLTLLTIGTHLPGYFYDECQRYGNGRKAFLDAIHCTDQLLQGFVEALQDRGDLDDTLLVVTADHHLFANPQMTRLFGEDAIQDRRLPLVLLGAGAEAIRERHGAGYDLAPTVLDLLGIEHNAKFATGRSILGEAREHHYFVTRYHDVFDGQLVQTSDECHDTIEPALPLDRCRKSELHGLLATINTAFSAPPPRMSCDVPEALVAHIPLTPDAPISVRLGGTDIADMFIHSERPVAPQQAGVYLLEVAADGALASHRYFAPDDPPPTFPENGAWLALFRPGEDTSFAADWHLDNTSSPSIMIGSNGQVVREVNGDSADGVSVTFDAAECSQLLAPPP